MREYLKNCPIHNRMNQERKLESCIRFWCHGSIANSAKSRIDKIITVSQKDAEAMIEEWVIKQY